MVVWGGLTYSWEKKRSERQRRKGKIYPSEYRVWKNIKDKKDFLSEQCKDIEENNRMRKTRDLFKKIRDTEGTFHVKMGTMKDRNGMDLTQAGEKAMATHSSVLAWRIPGTGELGGLLSLGSHRVGHDWSNLAAAAEAIKERWQDYTEELYKKDLHDPDNHDGVITHLEPDILECEVKWALGSITLNKASGGDGIPVELWKCYGKMMLWKCCTQYGQNPTLFCHLGQSLLVGSIAFCA